MKQSSDSEIDALLSEQAAGWIVRLVANDLSAGRLVRPFELGIKIPPEFAYFLVYPEGSAHDPRIVAFREWILEEARHADTA